MTAKGKRRVLLIYRVMIPSVRLCGHCQMEYLAGQGKVEYRAVQEMKLASRDLDWADIVLLGRLDSWYEYQLTQMAREAGKYVAYILDDDLLNIPPQVSSARNYGQRQIQGYIRGMIDLSDAIISPSPLLLEKYARDKQAIQIEEPAIDPLEYRPHGTGGPVKIGFAGSIDRIDDIEDILREALIQTGDRFGDAVVFEFLGARPAFAERLGARCIPYIDSYEGYRRTLNALQWDIGLAPMPDTPFHACKHYNKFSEYAAAGTVGIFSDVYPYTRLRAFPDCAVLCENTPESWARALGALIEDADRRERLRKQVSECALIQLSLPASAKELEAALPDPTRLKTTGTIKCRWLGFMKVRNVLKRVTTKVRGYGISGLVDAAITRAKGIVKQRQA
jgi:hypothetical protein